MPQMMPINWLMSFFLFMLLFIMFNIMNYYIYNIKMKFFSINNKINCKNFFWKW